MLLGCLSKAANQRSDDSILKAGTKIGDHPARFLSGLDWINPVLADITEHCGFQPAEGEVQLSFLVVDLGQREDDRPRIALASQAVDDRSARVAEAEQFRYFIERLAGSIVTGSSE